MLTSVELSILFKRNPLWSISQNTIFLPFLSFKLRYDRHPLRYPLCSRFPLPRCRTKMWKFLTYYSWIGFVFFFYLLSVLPSPRGGGGGNSILPWRGEGEKRRIYSSLLTHIFVIILLPSYLIYQLLCAFSDHWHQLLLLKITKNNWK